MKVNKETHLRGDHKHLTWPKQSISNSKDEIASSATKLTLSELASSQMRLWSRILAFPLVTLVVIYQKTLSPDHGPRQVLYPYGFCQMHPTCSEFARLTLLNEGVIGLPKIIKRLISCR